MKKHSPKREFADFVIDINNCIRNIENFTKGFDFENFSKDQKTIYAVVRALEIIGEATKNIPAPVKRNHPEIPWKDMLEMRNKLIHEYFGVNIKVVWKTIKEDIPFLKEKIGKLMDELRIKKII